MSARTVRARLLATALAVAALTLTACDNGEGIRDEGSAADGPQQPSWRLNAASAPPRSPST
ncbi:hypothetical protein ACFU9Y_31095 [Streptomyces sp. NPDC057621]|uniref:hypothetical protein n=1 Tax=Streptomyces sp. NPDC057621 TaxID=3346186 RepID=UPI0036841E0C